MYVCVSESVCVFCGGTAWFCCEKVCIDQVFMGREKEEREGEKGQNRSYHQFNWACLVHAKRKRDGDQKGTTMRLFCSQVLLIHIHTFYLIMIFCFDSPSIIDFYSASYNLSGFR